MGAFELAQQVKKGKTLQGSEMESFIEHISKKIGAKIVKEEDWFRKHDSKKYPYTKSSSLKEEFSYFCDAFVQKLTHIPDEKKAKKQWAMETAAWVEYRINLTDHFMTDSCGKVASVMSTFVCILSDCSLPIFSDKTEYLAQAPKRRRTLKSDDSLDKKYKKWEMYYLKKFPNNKTETFQLYLNPENQEKYYRQNALDNLMIISKTSKTGIRSTSGYANKKAQIKELSQIEVKPLVIAQFSSLIDYFFQQKNNEINEKFISELLKHIAYQLNEKSVEVNVDTPIEGFFRTQDGEHPYAYPYTSHVNLGFEFENFLREINERLKNSHKYNILETLALIHYRIFLNHHFFKDGNNRIAIAFVTYVCIREGIHLPKFSESDSLKKYYNREEVRTHVIGNDPQFSLWFSFYKSLFTQSDSSNNVLIDVKEDFEDGWDVTVEKTLDKEFTYLLQNSW